MQVGLADQNGAGAAQLLHNNGVLGGNAIIEDGAGHRGACACRVDVVFDRDGYAVQGTAATTADCFGIEGRCLLQGRFAHDRYKCIQLGVVDFDALEQRLHQRSGGGLAIGEALAGFGEREMRERDLFREV